MSFFKQDFKRSFLVRGGIKMKKRIQDERIIHEARKQNSLGFTILYYGLLLDLLYRQFILQEPFEKLWDLALLFFGVTFYLAGKRILTGIAFNASKIINTKQLLLSASIASIIFASINYWWIGIDSLKQLLFSSFVFFIIFFLMMFFMRWLTQKKNNEMIDED